MGVGKTLLPHHQGVDAARLVLGFDLDGRERREKVVRVKKAMRKRSIICSIGLFDGILVVATSRAPTRFMTHMFTQLRCLALGRSCCLVDFDQPV